MSGRIFVLGILSFVLGFAAASAGPSPDVIFASEQATPSELSTTVLASTSAQTSGEPEAPADASAPAETLEEDPYQAAMEALRQESAQSDELADKFEAWRTDKPYTVQELEELEDFREQLDIFTTDLEQLVRQIPADNVYDYPEKIGSGRAQVAELTPEELDMLQTSYSEYAGFWSAPADILLRMGQRPLSFDRPGAGQPDAVPTAPSVSIPQRPNCASFGGNPTCSECPAPPAGGLATLIALQAVELTACAACDFIDADFFVAAVEVPNPVKFICLLIKQGIQFARLGVEGALEVNLECQQNYHRALTHALLDETVSSRATQLSFDFFSALTIRLEIEDALLLEEDARVSRFQLPATQGGFLDRTDGVSVRYVVEDTIRMQALARGIPTSEVGNAEDELAAGDAHLASGEYTDAYARYRKAYRAAVRFGRGD